MSYSAITLTTKNSSTSEQHRYVLKLSNEINLKNSLICLTHCSIYYTWKNVKNIYDNNKLSYTHLASGKKHDIVIPDGSYDITDINNYIHFTMIQNGYNKTPDDVFGINIYPNHVYNRITVSVNNEFEVNFSPGFAEFLGFDVFTIKDNELHGKHVPKTERVNTVIVNCNLAENIYNFSSNALYTFTPESQFGTLMSIKPYYPIWTRCINASYNYIEVWFTDQENRPLEIDDNILITLHIKDNL